MKRFAGIAVALGVVGLVTAFTLWILPAEEFIFTPHEAKPLAERIQVEGSRPREEGGVYYVDVFVRRTTRLEDLFPFRFNTVEVVDGTVRFLAPGIQTKDAITARHVNGNVTNLTNVT